MAREDQAAVLGALLEIAATDGAYYMNEAAGYCVHSALGEVAYQINEEWNRREEEHIDDAEEPYVDPRQMTLPLDLLQQGRPIDLTGAITL